MSDSFADLWNSTAPSKPTAPQKLGSIQPTLKPRPPQNDLFSQLSSAGSGPPSRTMTPSHSSPAPKASATAKSSSGDAFSSLFSPGSGFSSKSTENMTMAQRAEEAERRRREQLLRNQNQQVQSRNNDAWSGLDSLGGLGATGGKPDTTTLDDDWGFGSATSASATSTTKPSIPTNHDNDDDWGLGEFSSSKMAPSVTQPQKGGSLWDLDDFTSSALTQSRRKPDSPSRDFDFGNREDNDDLLSGFGSSATNTSRKYVKSTSEEDDILGALSRPVDEIQKEREREQAVSATRSPPRSRTSNLTTGKNRSPSPPPHILGRLVEMGFGINEARVALVAAPNTENGEEAWVQGALEILINNDAGGSVSTPSTRQSGRDERRRDDGLGSDHEGDDTPRPSRQASSLQRDRETGTSRPHPRREPTQGPSEGDQTTNLQDQADKLLSQASEIGKGLFSRANAAWKEGKEKVQKAYEEQYGGKDSRKATPSGRPAWMVDGEGFKDNEDEMRGKQKTEQFRDEDGVHEVRDREPERRRRKPEPNGEQRAKEREQAIEVDLFSSSSETTPASSIMSAASSITGAYVSKWRHGRPKNNANVSSSGSSVASSSNSSAPATARNRPTIPSRPRTPPPPHPSTRITASTSSLSLSSQHKSRATSAFKLGDYPAAETAYSQAIEALPEGYALSILLYNNRALTRLKMGNLGGVLEDTGVVCRLVGSGESSAGRGKISVKGADGKLEDVNLGDALVKAWKRRAEALEGKEKWEEAGKDWEAVAGAEWASASIRGEGVRGAGRCRRMVSQPNKAGAEDVAAHKPKPKPKPVARPAVQPNANSQAVSSLRAANAVAESEDAQKHALKDSVDAKLLAWKGGKETNIRALLASLDTILWTELGVQKLNMSELITEGQVKIKYMKAIGKVHPDKLNATNSTVEQRMIAGGVFGALNEAWNAFKP
ncbi:hypothetical protein D9758_000377 [Tetrapyrgos nigripes]|uniref:UBA domain-containing protein n=1 Tax=Tetrapyrgos nigripes TaxID=182062 RepID=A0A8H5LZB5_9AGAR|nr:hypothetical protein D9758_000377 [Tetrapyrgos nigripes]